MSEPLHILCFGNPLHGDDGFGPAVGESLRQRGLPGGVKVFDCGIRGLDALGLFEDCVEVLLVDAMAGHEAGRLHQLQPGQIPVEATTGGHGAGVGYLLKAVHGFMSQVPKMTVLAAEIGPVTPFTLGLSAPVQQAVADTVALIGQGWLQPREVAHGAH